MEISGTGALRENTCKCAHCHQARAQVRSDCNLSKGYITPDCVFIDAKKELMQQAR
jgi:hypothetical protein